MPAPERDERPPVSMRDLLASCAAAATVSTPPEQDPEPDERVEAARPRSWQRGERTAGGPADPVERGAA